MKTQKQHRKEELLALLQNIEMEQESADKHEDSCPPEPPELPAESFAENEEANRSSVEAEEDEGALLDQCRKGKRKRLAFNRFVWRYVNTVYNYVQLLVPDAGQSARITTAVFAAAFHQLPRFRPGEIESELFVLAERELFKAAGGWHRTLVPFRTYRQLMARLGQKEIEEETAVDSLACRDIDRLLVAYLDGELSQKEMERVEAHVMECERCALELDELEQALGMVQRVEPLNAPTELIARVNEALDREPSWLIFWRSAGLWIRQSPVSLSHMAMVFLCLTTAVVWSNSRSQQAQYRELEGQIAWLQSDVTRAARQFGMETFPRRIVIATGALAEGQGVELLADFLAEQFPGSPKNPLETVPLYFIPAPLSDVETTLRTFAQSLRGGRLSLKEEEPHKDFTVKKLIIAFPKHTSSQFRGLLNSLDPLKSEGEGTAADAAETVVDLYLLAKESARH